MAAGHWLHHSPTDGSGRERWNRVNSSSIPSPSLGDSQASLSAQRAAYRGFGRPEEGYQLPSCQRQSHGRHRDAGDSSKPVDGSKLGRRLGRPKSSLMEFTDHRVIRSSALRAEKAEYSLTKTASHQGIEQMYWQAAWIASTHPSEGNRTVAPQTRHITVCRPTDWSKYLCQ